MVYPDTASVVVDSRFVNPIPACLIQNQLVSSVVQLVVDDYHPTPEDQFKHQQSTR